MPKKELIIINIEENPILSLEELCRATRTTPEFIVDLIEYGAIEPYGFSLEEWQFDIQHVRRVRRAIHLNRDLEVNTAGVALILDLLEEMEELQKQLQLFRSTS